jgi:glycosyltransferase involved in cell wall biosynthesis
VNEPVGILRLVDPFRAADVWVPLAPRGYRVAVEQVSWPPRAADVTRIAAVAAREGAHIVHAHGHWANLLAVPAARAVRARVVCTRCPGAALAESLAIRAADAVMCDSREERDRCVRRQAIAAEKVCVVHPGVDVSRFPARTPDATPLLVAVGALFARNRHLDLLEAVARVRVFVPQLRVICAGEGPMRPALQQRIAFFGLGEAVHLAGHVGDVPSLLARAHLAWTPGIRSTIEAMAAGVPAVSPWRELIGAEIATPRADATAIADRLLAFLKDPKIGASLRKRAEKEFSLDALRVRLGALYDALLAAQRTAA